MCREVPLIGSSFEVSLASPCSHGGMSKIYLDFPYQSFPENVMKQSEHSLHVEAHTCAINFIQNMWPCHKVNRLNDCYKATIKGALDISMENKEKAVSKFIVTQD